MTPTPPPGSDDKHPGLPTTPDQQTRDPRRPDTDPDESHPEGRRTIAQSPTDKASAMTVADADRPVSSTSSIFRQSLGAHRYPQNELDEIAAVASAVEAGDAVPRLERDEREYQATVADTSSQDSRAVAHSSESAIGRLDQSLNIRSRPVSGDPLFGGGDPSDYRIVRKLAEGGMGVVYVARQTSLDRELAIKTLKPLEVKRPSQSATRGKVSEVQRQRREMFLSEALVTANLVHPHIVPIHDLCQTDDGHPFYAMEHIHGSPWDERIRSMSQSANLDVLLKVADAVAYAHHHGVINRDLKPENVMLGDFGEVVVLDWGLAMPAADAVQHPFQSPAAAIGAGTPAYMAPELWTGPAEAIGTWSDIYLLGAILFEIITGDPPHEFPEPPPKARRSTVRRLIDDVVRNNTIIETEHTGELMQIARRAMHTDPDKRFGSVQELQHAIGLYRQHEESRRLTTRADQLIAGTSNPNRPVTYETFQDASALYVEAAREWPENAAAVEGLRTARLQYAELAKSRGDYNLGLQIASRHDGAEFKDLRRRMKRAKDVRSGIKWTALLATVAFVVAGAYAWQKKLEVERVHGTNEVLTARNKQLEVEEADLRSTNARLQESNSDLQTNIAMLESTRDALIAGKSDLEQQNASLQSNNKTLVTENTSLASQRQSLTVSNRRLTKQNEELGRQRLQALLDLRNSGIHASIRNGDYAQAVQETDALLEDLQSGELQSLPDATRAQRTNELTVLRKRLVSGSLKNASPVQTMAASPDASHVAWADAEGTVRLSAVDPQSRTLPAVPDATLQLPGRATTLTFSDDGRFVLIASGRTLYVWSFDSSETTVIESPDGEFTDVAADTGMLLACTSANTIAAWSSDTHEKLWSLRSTSATDELTVVPGSDLLIVSGSRGALSADVLAWRLPPANDATARPKLLGQLRFPRSVSFPVYRVCASPDGRSLVLSNRHDGRLLVLPRRERSSSEAVARGFPFLHPTELADQTEHDGHYERQSRPVNDIAFSADGRFVATASDDHTIGLWEFTDGPSGETRRLQFSKLLEGHGAKVTSVAFAERTGQILMSGSADRYCRLWNLDDYDSQRRQLLQSFEVSARPTHGMNFIPTAHVSVRSDGNSGTVFNRDNRLQQGAITSACLSRDGRHVVTGAADGTVVIWNTSNGGFVRGSGAGEIVGPQTESFDEGHDYYIRRMMFLPPDGRTLATTGFDGTLCLWNAKISPTAGTQRLRMTGLELVNAVASSPDGRLLFTSSVQPDNPVEDAPGHDPTDKGGTCDVWLVDDLLNESVPQPVMRLSGLHKRDITAIAVSPSGTFAATGAADGLVAVWALHDDGLPKRLPGNDGARPAESITTGSKATRTHERRRLITSGQLHEKDTFVTHLEWLDDKRLLTAGLDGKLQICEFTPRRRAAPAERPGAKDAARDGRSAGTSSFQNNDRRISPPLGLNVVLSFNHDPIPIERLAFSSDRSRFLTLSVRADRTRKLTSGEVQLWNIAEPNPLQTVRPAVVSGNAAKSITSVDWSPDDSRVALVADGRLQILNSSTWRTESVFDAPRAGIADAAFVPRTSADSEPLIATFDGAAAHLWNLKDRSHVADFRPMFAVSAVALTGDDDLTGDNDQPLLLTGDRSVRAFAPDGADGRWEHTRFKIGSPHRGLVTSIAADPTAGSRRFATSSADGSVAIWERSDSDNTAVQLQHFPRGDAAVAQVAWSPDGRWLLAVSEDSTVRIDSTPFREGEAPQREGEAQHGEGEAPEHHDVRIPPDGQPCALSCAAFSSDGRYFAVAGRRTDTGESVGWVWQWSPDERVSTRLHCALRRQTSGGFRGLEFLPKSPYLVTGEQDGAAIVWNWQPDELNEGLAAYEAFALIAAGRRTAHAAAITAVDIADGRFILTASDDGTAILWRNPFAHLNR